MTRQHADAHQARHIDLRAELGQLHRAHKGQDQAEKHAGDGDDGQGLHPAFIHGGHEILAAHLGPAQKKPPDGERHLAAKTEKVPDRGRQAQGRVPQAGQKRRVAFFAGRAFLRGNGEGHVQQAFQSFGQSQIHIQLAGARGLDHLHQKDQQTGVPPAQTICFQAQFAHALVRNAGQGSVGFLGPRLFHIPAAAHAYEPERPLSRSCHLRTCFHPYTIPAACLLRKRRRRPGRATLNPYCHVTERTPGPSL